MKHSFALISLALVCVTNHARADSLAETFARGNRDYVRGDYAEAVREYEALIEAGVDDPDVTYNLASAYGSLGRYGQAVRYFERTLRLDPGDDAARSGLKLARGALGERQARETGEAIVADRPPLSEALFSRFTSNTLAWALLVCAWLASACGLALFVVRGEAARLALGIGGVLSLLVTLIALVGLGVKNDWGKPGVRAVVVSERAALRDGPDEAAHMQGEIPEGSLARVLSREGSYLRVRLPDAREGFMRAQDLGQI